VISEGEQVYVVKRSVLPDCGHGVEPLRQTFLERIYTRGRFVPRAAVEEDATRKQIIPYAVVARGGEIFCFERTRGGGERRLFGLRSVGVGGHINPVDKEDVIHDALRRELEEELVLPRTWRATIVGLLNDDTTAVGAVHLGIVAVVDPGPGEVKVREADTMSGSFVSRKELLESCRRKRETFETWSALLLDRIDEVLAWTTPLDSYSPTRKRARISTT